MLRSNLAINGWRALKQGAREIRDDLAKTWYEEVPFSYAVRTPEARRAYQENVQKYGVQKAMEMHKENGWGPGSFSPKRAAILGGLGYATADTVYRVVSGGSIYRNKSGEQDIVGVPFI